jgi:hypothetical protein
MVLWNTIDLIVNYQRVTRIVFNIVEWLSSDVRHSMWPETPIPTETMCVLINYQQEPQPKNNGNLHLLRITGYLLCWARWLHGCISGHSHRGKGSRRGRQNIHIPGVPPLGLPPMPGVPPDGLLPIPGVPPLGLFPIPGVPPLGLFPIPGVPPLGLLGIVVFVLRWGYYNGERVYVFVIVGVT